MREYNYIINNIKRSLIIDGSTVLEGVLSKEKYIKPRFIWLISLLLKYKPEKIW